MLDLVIRGGTVVDGTGARGVRADVGVAGDTIACIGSELPPADHILDATGCIVSPGFVDIHSHSDYTLLLNRNAESSVRQGVTTEVLGNCGASCAPLPDPRYLPFLAPEYIPWVDVRWQTFGQWLDVMESGGVSINVVSLVGHGALRAAVMGTDSRPASADEIRDMTKLLEESLEAGAFGLSSGLEYAPGKNAGGDELAALCREVGRRDGFYATHIRNRDYSYLEAIREALTTAAVSGARLQISHVSPRWGAADGSNEVAVAAIDRARESGVDVMFDNHPYTFGRGTVMSALPPWAFEGGVDQLWQRLRDPAQRVAMREYTNPQWKHVHQGRWELLIVYDAPANRELQGRTVAEISQGSGRDPWDVVFDLLLAEGESPNRLLWSAPLHQQGDVDMAFRHPQCIIMSDGSSVAPYGPCRDVRHIYAYGWATNVLRRYVRERGVLSMEEAIHKMSQKPARRIGLTDRGALRVGQKADVVVFDRERVIDRATFDRPISFPQGIRNVLVNGVMTVRDGEHTGARAGRVLRWRA
jgi:N-acyl-D-amino-acid deacylase